MTDLLAAAERVKAAVEAEEAEKYIRLTQAELDAIYTYQFTMPTSPSPGFVYKREYWRIPGETRWWRGPNEGSVRFAIGEHQQESHPANSYRGPLESFWYVYTCEKDPNNEDYILHKPKEARVIS